MARLRDHFTVLRIAIFAAAPVPVLNLQKWQNAFGIYRNSFRICSINDRMNEAPKKSERSSARDAGEKSGSSVTRHKLSAIAMLREEIKAAKARPGLTNGEVVIVVRAVEGRWSKRPKMLGRAVAALSWDSQVPTRPPDVVTPLVRLLLGPGADPRRISEVVKTVRTLRKVPEEGLVTALKAGGGVDQIARRHPGDELVKRAITKGKRASVQDPKARAATEKKARPKKGATVR